MQTRESDREEEGEFKIRQKEHIPSTKIPQTFFACLFIFLLLLSFLVPLKEAQSGEVEAPISGKLSVYGFGMFDFCITQEDPSFIGGSFVECTKGGSFAQFLFTPFFDFQITERLRALLSMEVLYAPELEIFGEVKAETEGMKGEVVYPNENQVKSENVEKVEYNTKGYGDVLVEGFGEIDFQFVFIEYVFHQLAVLRAGKYLNPFGLWLEGRDAPIRYPFLHLPKIYQRVNRFVPHYNVGIQLRGEMRFLKYAFQVGNGSGSVANVIDRNQDKALGGTISVKIPTEMFFGSLIGGSFYTDEDFAKGERATTYGGHILLNISKVLPGKISLIGEVAYRTTPGENWISYYISPGYNFYISTWAISPYLIYDFADFNVDAENEGEVTHIGGGINFSPIPQLIIKTEVLVESGSKIREKEVKNNVIISGGISYAF